MGSCLFEADVALNMIHIAYVDDFFEIDFIK